MQVTANTRRILAHRRTVAKWIKEGFEQVDEGGGLLWQIYRGHRLGQQITEARIAPDGMSVYVKIERVI